MQAAPRQVVDARAGVRHLDREEGFVGTGITVPGGASVVLVIVTDASCAAAHRAPAEFEGVPVRIEVSWAGR